MTYHPIRFGQRCARGRPVVEGKATLIHFWHQI